MKLALLGRNELGFIDGTYTRSLHKGELAKQWDRCNAIVLSWISCIVSQELISSIVLTSSAKKIWDEFAKRNHKSNFTRIYQLCKEITTQSKDLYNSKVLGIGKECSGLYWLRQKEIVSLTALLKDQRNFIL